MQVFRYEAKTSETRKFLARLIYGGVPRRTMLQQRTGLIHRRFVTLSRAELASPTISSLSPSRISPPLRARIIVLDGRENTRHKIHAGTENHNGL